MLLSLMSEIQRQYLTTMSKEKQSTKEKKIIELMEQRDVEIQALKKILTAFEKDKTKEKS